jgi:hypothetical protein
MQWCIRTRTEIDYMGEGKNNDAQRDGYEPDVAPQGVQCIPAPENGRRWPWRFLYLVQRKRSEQFDIIIDSCDCCSAFFE